MSLPFVLVGSLLIIDTLAIMSVSNLNMGVVMPALLGLPLLLYGMFYNELSLWFSMGAGVIVEWVIIGLYIAFILLVAVLSAVIARTASKKARPGADAVIVLGAAVHGSKPSRALVNRLEAALDYALKNPESLIVVAGGKGRQEHVTEASAMRDYLLSRGVEPERILTEENSRSTYENFTFSKEMLDPILPKGYRVAYATNSFHVFRAGLAAREAGLEADGIGCSSPFYIVPNYYIRESMAIVRYLVFVLR